MTTKSLWKATSSWHLVPEGQHVLAVSLARLAKASRAVIKPTTATAPLGGAASGSCPWEKRRTAPPWRGSCKPCVAPAQGAYGGTVAPRGSGVGHSKGDSLPLGAPDPKPPVRASHLEHAHPKSQSLEEGGVRPAVCPKTSPDPKCGPLAARGRAGPECPGPVQSAWPFLCPGIKAPLCGAHGGPSHGPPYSLAPPGPRNHPQHWAIPSLPGLQCIWRTDVSPGYRTSSRSRVTGNPDEGMTSTLLPRMAGARGLPCGSEMRRPGCPWHSLLGPPAEHPPSCSSTRNRSRAHRGVGVLSARHLWAAEWH